MLENNYLINITVFGYIQKLRKGDFFPRNIFFPENNHLLHLHLLLEYTTVKITLTLFYIQAT